MKKWLTEQVDSKKNYIQKSKYRTLMRPNSLVIKQNQLINSLS